MTSNPPDYLAMASYYTRQADEFLQAYFVLGLNGVRLNARYFVMAHCLALAFKASLASRSAPIEYATHDLEALERELEARGDAELAELRPDAAAREVFARLFSRTTGNFIVQNWLDHRDSLEILLCYEHTADLKYGIAKDGQYLSAVTTSTTMMNTRFLRYVAVARRHFPDQGTSGGEIADFVASMEEQFPEHFGGAGAIIK